jgi:centriolin
MLKQHSEGSAVKHTEFFQELAELESALQEQHEVNASLQQTQGDLSAYETELEAQLKLRDAEANQLREELEKLTRLTQVSKSISN